MKAFSYSEARQNLSKMPILAQDEEVEIRRRDDSAFELRSKRRQANALFDVPGIKAQLATADILAAIEDSRAR